MWKRNDCSLVRLSCSQSLDSINHCQFVNQYYRQLTNIAYHLSKAPSQQTLCPTRSCPVSQGAWTMCTFSLNFHFHSITVCRWLAAGWTGSLESQAGKPAPIIFPQKRPPHMARNRRRDGRSLLWMAVSLGLNPYVCALPKVCHEMRLL